ncbi:ABC transporter substrate-binding protein [Brevibacillus brevis]|uniref:ABC transporter substrate-binding protein n=1 Tax=Brevibacillus brevis TaxID=1393 RepID=UPI000D0EB77C|nr:ABC transporter substrate-binding protein [Brevibacillus brevis]PSJ65474.1 ABC transporter substrate-binding protein [Brevibacillus brevis]RED33972.1 amino acid ABC transporter substrate-binding protein (PAAT family) [Brevibacillus brevis]GEC89479.1 ABC transporter substrate-binding protein [Brevibacillus brevis]VEF92458.1 Sulfate starvation-induced protein 7 [Brevibacillus brevis]
MRKKSLFPVALLVSSLLFSILGGCGSNITTPPAQPNANASTNSSTPSTPPAQPASEVKLKLVHEGKLTFAMSGLIKPLNYKDTNGVLTGFDVEIGNEIAKRIGLEANPVTNPWETILQGLKGGKYDAIIGSMTHTEERAKQVDFTDPYYISGGQIFIAETNESIKTKDDLKGKIIGVVQASTHKDAAETLTDKTNVKGYPSDIYALQDLLPGRVDAVITDRVVGTSAIKNQGLKIKATGEVLNKENIAIAVTKDNPELTKKINEAIKAMVEDGTYEQISMKWFGSNLLK